MTTKMKMINPVEIKTLPEDLIIKSRAPVNILSIEAITPETDYKVKGTFVNVETPGQPAKVSCRLYKGMQVFEKLFLDGERCVIPHSVARFINERIHTNKHKYSTDADGNPQKISDLPQPRYKFIVEEIIK